MAIPKAGDIYVFTGPAETRAGVSYEKGDRLELIEPTGHAPHLLLSNISNWYVRCKHWAPPQPQSVWSCIWVMIEYGWIRKVSNV